MDLLEFHHMDNRPVTFERLSVLLIEPHVSGAGSLVRLGPIERPHEMHLREEYDHVKTEVLMSSIERGFRDLQAEQAAGKTIPFG